MQHHSTLQPQGREDQRYRLWLNNLGSAAYEVVVTVSSLDVFNGQPGSLKNHGYVLEPDGSLVVEGFRRSERGVAAFRSVSPDGTYTSSNAASGSRNLSVIDMALLKPGAPASGREAPVDGPQAFPADARSDGDYASPPCYRD